MGYYKITLYFLIDYIERQKVKLLNQNLNIINYCEKNYPDIFLEFRELNKEE